VAGLSRLNAIVYRVERATVVAALLAMAWIVFLDVVHRRWTDPESKLAAKLAAAFGLVPGTTGHQTLQDVSGTLVLLACVGLVYLGARTASARPLLDRGPRRAAPMDDRPTSRPRALAIALAAVGASFLAMWALFGSGDPADVEACTQGGGLRCGLFPAGLIWSQPLALVLTLWVGFLGASMATHDNRHLKVEALQKVLPERWKRICGLLAGVAAAAFCLLLCHLAVRYVGYQHQDWIDSERLGGHYDGLDLAKWQGALVLPFAFGLMALRFLGNGVLALQGKLSDTMAELADLEPSEEPGAPVDPQADVETRPLELAELSEEAPPEEKSP
jgi:TRAP-type C4-dicarboxylate transport system permease small subunit